MSYDPFGDDPDADIFRDDNDEDIIEEAKAADDIEAGSGHKHTLDGSECPTCGVIHPTYLADELPPDAIEAILTFFDAMPNEFVASILESGGGNKKSSPQADMLTSFLGYTQRMEKNNALGPMMLAIIEHLDEQTGGRISAKWRIYEAERKLVIGHAILKSANTALDDALTNDAKPAHVSLLELAVDFARERLDMSKAAYLEAVELINYEPVESILEHGVYPDDEERETQQSIAEDLYERLLIK